MHFPSVVGIGDASQLEFCSRPDLPPGSAIPATTTDQRSRLQQPITDPGYNVFRFERRLNRSICFGDAV